MAGSLRRLVARAGGSVTSQAVTAGGSVVLQLIAVRFLGPEAFGAYAIMMAVLVAVTTVFSSWVGDSLTVLDRFNPRVRAALCASILGLTAAGTVVGVVFALALHLADTPGVVAFALLTVLWLPQESARRLLNARLEFGRLVLNDVVYVGVTLAILAGLWLTGAPFTLTWILGAMCAGQFVSLGMTLALLPSAEYRLPRPSLAGLGEVTSFAAWRSAQASLRPVALLVMRVAIDTFASRTVLAAVEAGRLLMSPALTVVQGAGSYLLPTFVRRRDAGVPIRPRNALAASLVLIAGTLACGVAAIAVLGYVGPLITGGAFTLDAVTVGGWVAYTVSFSATLPLSMMAAAYTLSRLVFMVRAAETAIGLAAMLVVLAVAPELAHLAPYCIGFGGLASGFLLWWHLRRTAPVPSRNEIPHETHAAE
ncbi:hypothetical protein GT755_26150 [Herbidospora sp. NEAU-GS84]|uniref:Lipopolysaccharide biosynthesis protein n=1 Tax=Herbidospora solisilvae TaxID=2696284 RepID=A0A7C9N9Q0_9ACTN|nr:hypothetical protein [Herbidospora solisilvae]NAS25153.1 hypothetical protein [Herbidospora solisilvae]